MKDWKLKTSNAARTEIPIPATRDFIQSHKISAGDCASQDALISRMHAEGYLYLDTTMIYAGEMVIRFKRAG